MTGLNKIFLSNIMPGSIDTLRKSIQLIINFVKVAGQKVGKLNQSKTGAHTLALTLARTGFISFRLLLIIICPVINVV